LNDPPELFDSAITGLVVKYLEDGGHDIKNAIDEILKTQTPRFRSGFKRPDPASDKLYRSIVIHPPGDEACQAVCSSDPSDLVPRRVRTEEEDNLAIHYGAIAPGDQVMKYAVKRDALAREKDVLCFEMEAA
jgi:nucleoside phosphorylase